jgi:predicted ATPase
VTISHTVHAMVARRLQADFEDAGEQRVKNIAQPVRAFRWRRPQALGAQELRFGRFVLQPRQRLLLAGGEPTALDASAFDVLLALAECAGHLVTRSELINRVWPSADVEEHDLSASIQALRKALGADIVVTVPGRGYRFTPSVESEGLPAAARADAAVALQTNLPATLTPLIGRNDDIAALGSLFDDHRLVTLVGAGGMGKTLLAQHLLAARRGRYAHGVCWVELAPLGDPAAIVGTITAALGVRTGGGEPLDALIQALVPLDLLLALDNAEHLLADVARVAEALHRAAPKLRLLVTSQAPLKLAAERVVRLGPLSVPQGPLPAAEALGFGAVALFAERAQAADSRFVLTDAAAPLVIQLCRELDGMALAIELAAARAPTLGVQRLAASMHERLKLLTSSRNRAAPARQQTLRAALEWSHGLLAEREQALFRRMAVIAGSATLELVQRAGTCERWSEWDVLDALDTLVDRSLVGVVAVDGSAMPRYRLLDSPRALAREQLRASGEAERLRRLHALAIRDQLTAMRDERESGRAGDEANRMAARIDSDNAREAFVWARQAGVPELALELGALLLRVLPNAALAERLALCDACESLITQDRSAALQARAWLEIARALGDVRAKRSWAASQHAIAAARRMAPADEGGAPLLYLALCTGLQMAMLADEALARRMLSEAMALEQSAWPASIRFWGAGARHSVALFHGDPAEGARLIQHSLALEREAGVQSAPILNSLVDAQLAAGDARAALASGRELLAQLQGSRHEMQLALVRLNLAAACLALDDGAQARPLLQAGWAHARVYDALTPWFADYLALLSALEGRPRAAARLVGYADRRYVDFDDARQRNEAQAVERARASALAALGETELNRLQASGSSLRDEAIAALAFGRDDESTR